MPPVLWRALLSCLLITSGCQAILGIEDLRGRPDGGAAPADAAAPDAGRPDFAFAVLTVNATIPLDGTNLVDVEIHRSGGFDGEVSVAAKSPPTGVQVEPLTVPAGQITAQLAVSAQAPLVLGDTVSFDLVATASGLPARMASVRDAEITGKPGSLDVSFGAQATGYAAISFDADDSGSFNDLEVLPSGDILAFGWGMGGLGAITFALTRLTASGVPDATFQNGALVRTDFDSGSSGENAQGYAIGRQVDGSIIGIGWHSAGASFPPDIALAQYTADGGQGNPSFGNRAGGKSRLDLGGGLEQVTDGLVLPDSSILAVGQRSDTQLFIARATPGGVLDESFGPLRGGYHVLEGFLASGAHAVTIDAGKRILVAGFIDDESRNMAVLRYAADGMLDPAFGDGGVVVLGDPSASERAVAIAVRPDGRIVVAGDTNANVNVDFQVRQLLDDGSPDLSFGDQGVSTLPISEVNDAAEDMALLPDGRILVVGNAQGRGPIVARYTRDGALDPYFGDGGILDLYLGESGVARAIAQYGNAKILISGGNEGGTPGPGTFGVVVRMWM